MRTKYDQSEVFCQKREDNGLDVRRRHQIPSLSPPDNMRRKGSETASCENLTGETVFSGGWDALGFKNQKVMFYKVVQVIVSATYFCLRNYPNLRV